MFMFLFCADVHNLNGLLSQERLDAYDSRGCVLFNIPSVGFMNDYMQRAT